MVKDALISLRLNRTGPLPRRSPSVGGVPMSLEVPCPNCGPRPWQEFTFGGEFREYGTPDPEEDFARVYLRDNAPGLQRERWFHLYGCRRWLTIDRDTVTNRFDVLDRV
jgi:heterotetrameric sarcosine oxidase delta subunit